MAALLSSAMGGRTRAAVLQWAAALPASSYLIVAIPEAGSGPTHRRFFTLPELDHALSWLRWLNGTGHHIVGRPWDARHVLLDDLHPVTVEAMAGRPAAVVESSPGNFQLWLTLSTSPVAPDVASAAARLLAVRHGSDRGAASASQPGRLPGFTNRKGRHRTAEGLHPFALLSEANGPLVDPLGSAILAEAATTKAKPGVPISTQPGHCGPLRHCSPGEEHAEAMARLAATLPSGATLDRSRADFALAARLLSRGMVAAEVVEVILAGERAQAMPPVAAAAYARRTVGAARTPGPGQVDR